LGCQMAISTVRKDAGMFSSDTIKRRISCRTYKNLPIKELDRQKLRDFILTIAQGPFSNKVRFELIDLAGKERDEITTLATYGMIKGASTFILGAVTRGDRSMEDYGYCMEKIVLMATHLGLGTCWLGGTFNRSASASRINKRDNEVIPAITPVGSPSDRSIRESVVRFIAKSNSRKPWEKLFFCGETSTPLPRNIGSAYQLALDCVRVGPSASNRQPWRIIKEKDNDIYHFYVSRTPGMAKLYPDVSLQDVDMGIAMCHFEIAVHEMKGKGRWEILQSPLPQKGLEYIVSWTDEHN
jgi:nitroreductase